MRVILNIVFILCFFSCQSVFAEAKDTSVASLHENAQALYNTCVKHTPPRVNVILSKACKTGAISSALNSFSTVKKQTTDLVTTTETSRFVNEKCKNKKLINVKVPCAYWACNQVFDCFDTCNKFNKDKCLLAGNCVKSIKLDDKVRAVVFRK